MDIETLTIFVEVMRQGSFAAVARKRDLDPSSISRAIAGLEQELGIRLFQRTTRKLSPTEAGITYFNRIKPLLEEFQQASESVIAISGRPQGTLRITTSVSFGLKCIVPLLPKFETIYPELTIDLLLSDSRLDLMSERIDLAIRLGQLTDSTLIARKLMSTRYYVCACPDYIKQHDKLDRPQDITRHNCLLFPLAGFRSHWIFQDDLGKICKIPVSGNVIISNAIALKECAIAGMGLALLPHWLVNEDLEAKRLVKVLPDYRVTATNFDTSVWLVYPSRKYIPSKVKVFTDFLQQYFGDR